MSSGSQLVKTVCPRDCYDACGIVVRKQGEGIISVRGDPDHDVCRGSLCGKCSLAYNGAWRDPDVRLQHPLKRTGAKGEGRFERIGWDRAIAEIADGLGAILRDHPPSTVLQTHYTGTVSKIAGDFPLRFFNRLGATEVDPDTVCNKAGHAALEYTIGTSGEGFDPRTAADARCILVWGGNPSASGPHAHKHWLPGSGATVIVVDPIRHATAAAADIHLQPRPGTDGALAFALMHVAGREGLVDRDFLAAHTVGWGEIADDVRRATPAWGESVTGVPEADIVEAATIYARGPSLMWLGQGLQRQTMGGNAYRACAALCAATANIGRPGTGLLFLNGGGTRGLDDDTVPAPHLARGDRPTISHMDLAAALAGPGRSRALFTWNNNIAASSPEQTRLREALRREDLLHVAIELFATDTTDFADYVLPAASFLEFDDLVASYFHDSIAAQAKAMEPMGECLPNQEIFRRLARAMGFTEPELYEPDEDIIGTLLGQTGLGMSFGELNRAGPVQVDKATRIAFADLKFPTPSGRIEIASALAAADGHPRAPLPHADAPGEGDVLRVLSPASDWAMNSSYANDAGIRSRLGSPGVLVHPDEARTRNLADGAAVELQNETGRLPLTLKISADVPPGVALVHKGHWPRLSPGNANVNVLNPGARTDMAESSAVHSVEARLTAATPGADGD